MTDEVDGSVPRGHSPAAAGNRNRQASQNVPKPLGPPDDAIKRIAMDVGKDLVEYIEFMYPEMARAVHSWKSTRLSLRNHIYNDIMAMVRAADEGRHEQAIDRHDRHRRVMRKLRKARTVDEVRAATIDTIDGT